ncbi:hypothetical protein K438DRAFT_580704 [Mycena galopus ATCC 62051]|nr:hypothetical protein K438DRAFT_1012828 [Mycena galopus ATCC 62051]KAF8144466.1 hypothetical protein K438DRAFT_580704 [Mycena galopus ATCC 62051]
MDLVVWMDSASGLLLYRYHPTPTSTTVAAHPSPSLRLCPMISLSILYRAAPPPPRFIPSIAHLSCAAPSHLVYPTTLSILAIAGFSLHLLSFYLSFSLHSIFLSPSLPPTPVSCVCSTHFCGGRRPWRCWWAADTRNAILVEWGFWLRVARICPRCTAREPPWHQGICLCSSSLASSSRVSTSRFSLSSPWRFWLKAKITCFLD